VRGPECAQPGKDGYTSAKWTCEAILGKAQANYKGAWPVLIHRPSTILREDADKVGYKASLDWLNMMIHYSQKPKCVPEIRRNRGSIDLVLIKMVCESVVALLMEPDEKMC
jgi:thioester reductase-like protein